MTNAQIWLNKKYSDKGTEKRIVFEIYDPVTQSLKGVMGNLVIDNWPNLEEIIFMNFFNPLAMEDKSRAYTEDERMYLDSLVISNCPNLTTIKTNAIVKIRQLTLSSCLKLNHCSFSSNNLQGLNIENCPNISSLNLAGNELTSLDLRKLPELKWLTVNDNQLKELDIIQNTKLRKFVCDGNVQPIKTLQQKEQRLTTEVGNLKELLGKVKEEVTDYKLKIKERKLENFVQKLGVNREKVRNLSKAYQKLIKVQAQENFDQNAVILIEDDIETIKDGLLSGGWFTWKISLENAQELCRKCEKIAKLRIEQESLYQEQYQARQEFSPHNNNY